jgi:hypothetical protein
MCTENSMQPEKIKNFIHSLRWFCLEQSTRLAAGKAGIPAETFRTCAEMFDGFVESNWNYDCTVVIPRISRVNILNWFISTHAERYADTS